MADKIPVTFAYQGKEYKGYFNAVSGAGLSVVYFLMIDNFYQGSLQLYDSGWRFTSQTGKFEDMVDYFSDVITAWYE